MILVSVMAAIIKAISGNFLILTMRCYGRFAVLQTEKVYTVFDLILAGDAMQNLKLRVDFYYS